MDDGRFERLQGDELAKDRLAHGYAVTVHRAQGATVDAAHRYEDGGGRELAYVAMSRARAGNTVHVVADDLDQAAEDLTRDWSANTAPAGPSTPAPPPPSPSPSNTTTKPRPGCAPLSATPASKPNDKPSPPPSRRIPAPTSPRSTGELAELRRDRIHLLTGQGGTRQPQTGQAARRYIDAREKHVDAQRQAEAADSWRDRRHWRKKTVRWADEESTAETAYGSTVGTEIHRLDKTIADLEEQRGELQGARHERTAWLADHPEAVRRLRALDRELHPLPELPEIDALGQHQALDIRRYAGIRPPGPDHGVETDFGP